MTVKRHHYHYSSLSDFVTDMEAVVKAKAFKPEYKDRPAALEKDHADGWHGTETIEQTFAMARNGWEAGRAKLVSAFAAAATALSSQPDYVMDVGGAYPIVALAVAGDPACMVDFMPVEDRKRPVVRLTVNCCASAAYSGEALTNYGAAVLSYIDALEAHGFRVELTAFVHCAMNGDNNRRYNLHVMAKEAHEPMELDKLAFMFVQPSYLRRLVFAHMQSRKDIPKDMMRNCGTASSPVPDHDTEAGQLIIPGINTFSPNAPQLKTARAAADALAPVLERMLSSAGLRPPTLAFAAEGLAG